MKTLESNTNPHAAGKAAHSPLPWRVSGNHIEARPDPENSDTYWAEVAYLDTEWFERITEANAAFIVRACNSHTELTAMLLETTEALKEARRYLAGDAASKVYDETGEVQSRARDMLSTLEATP